MTRNDGHNHFVRLICSFQRSVATLVIAVVTVLVIRCFVAVPIWLTVLVIGVPLLGTIHNGRKITSLKRRLQDAVNEVARQSEDAED